MKKITTLFVIFFILIGLKIFAQPGSLDNSFLAEINPYYDYDIVYSTAKQSDGKVIFGGTLRVGRLNSDGSKDNTFNVFVDNHVKAVAIQADGKIIIAGQFTIVNSTSINRIARLNADGTTDLTFNVGTACSGTVEDIKIQDDGKIILAGDFEYFNNISSKGIVRLNPDGSFDNTFSVGLGASGTIESIVIQQDGKIVIGGMFNSFNSNYNCQNLARLLPNGTLDNTFPYGAGLYGNVFTLLIQPDGKILAVGNFQTYNSIDVNQIIRLNTDATLDESFQLGTGINSGYVYSVALQSDGKIIIGGSFTSYNENLINNLARLNSDGSFDNTFVTGTGPDNDVHKIEEIQTGKLIICGQFSNYNGVNITKIAKIYTNNPNYIADNKQFKNIKIYPNPVNDLLKIDFDKINIDLEINIYDIVGKNIYSANEKNIESLNINTSELKTGIYFLKIKTDNNILNYKFVKE